LVIGGFDVGYATLGVNRRYTPRSASKQDYRIFAAEAEFMKHTQLARTGHHRE